METDKFDPVSKQLAVDAYTLSGCKSHPEFVALFGDAIGLRTFRGWLEGQRAAPIAQLMLREFISGWRPSRMRESSAK